MALTKISGSILKDPLNLGEVSIGGTLTYQDVTNVDALGIGTFRSGINVSGGQIDVGSNIKIGTAGVITATSFVGDGSNLTGISGVTINNNSDNRLITGSGTANTLEGESTLNYGGNQLTFSGSATPLSGTGHNYSLNIYKDGGSGYGYLDCLTSSSNHTGWYMRAYHNGTYNKVIAHNTSDETWFETGGAERLRIISSGQVQIKETAGSSSDGASLKFYFGNNNATDVISSIYFANNSGNVARITGETRNGNNFGMIRFSNQVNGVDGESMRLNHDGGFCVGTDSTRTAEFTTPDGFSVRSRDSSKGQFQVSVSGATCGLLNRKSSNGHILSFRKDGTGVGHIGVNASAMYLNFGGTDAAAHQLDDYETGTFTCTVYYATGNTTGSHTNTTNINGYFEKIGNLVHISIALYPTNYNSGNTAIITKFSLPFTPVIRAAAAFYRYSGAANYGGMLAQSSQDDSGAYLNTDGFGYVIVGGTNQGSGYWGHHTGQINASGWVSGTYRVS